MALLCSQRLFFSSFTDVQEVFYCQLCAEALLLLSRDQCVLAVKGELWGEQCGGKIRVQWVAEDLEEGGVELQMQCTRAACAVWEGGMLSDWMTCSIPVSQEICSGP